jgi:hypothetical protein
MSFEEVTMYRLLCDRCGVSAQEDSDYYAWADKDSAKRGAEETQWLFTEDGAFCDDCTTWDEERDERVPKREPVAS